jgi:nucleoside-diphosphate-sugar epimerase
LDICKECKSCTYFSSRKNGNTRFRYIQIKLIKIAPAGNAYFITNDEPIKFWDLIGDFWEGFGYKRPYIGIPYFIVWMICWFLKIFFFIINLCGFDKHAAPEWELNNMNLIVGNRYYDIAKAKKDLGYKPKYTMKEGFKTTIEYFSYLREGDKKKE